jgi:hypothetical protein
MTQREMRDPRAKKLFLREHHGVGGDALPFAVSLHPGVGKSISMRESFPGLGLAAFLRDAGNDRDVRSEHAHAHVAGNRGSVGARVAFRFREQGRFVAGFAAGGSTDEIVGDDFLDHRGVVRRERSLPLRFEFLDVRGPVVGRR